MPKPFSAEIVKALAERVEQQTPHAIRLNIHNANPSRPSVTIYVNGQDRTSWGTRCYREGAAILLALLADARTGNGGQESDAFETTIRAELGNPRYLAAAAKWAIHAAGFRTAYINMQHLLAIYEDAERAGGVREGLLIAARKLSGNPYRLGYLDNVITTYQTLLSVPVLHEIARDLRRVAEQGEQQPVQP